MSGVQSLGMTIYQDGFTSTHAGWITAGVIVMATLALVQLIALAVGGYLAMKVVHEVKADVNELKLKALPIIATTTAIIADLKPKVQTISENAVQLSYTIREKAEQVGETVSKVNQTVQDVNETVADASRKTRSQVGHVNSMVNTALDSTEKLTNTVVHGINAPVKQVAGVIAALKTGFETLVKNYQGTGPVNPFKTKPNKYDF